MITRVLEPEIAKRFFSGKAIVLTGPRQAGKTTLIETILEPYKKETLVLKEMIPLHQGYYTDPELNKSEI
jgi:predicted AAA+ superfamily ATPase